MNKNPSRLLFWVFSLLGAIELAIGIFMLLLNNPTTRIIALPFCFVGLVFAGIGIGMYLSLRRRSALKEELIAGGYYEFATVISIDRNIRISINGRHPFVVVCRIERGGVLHEYKSDNLFTHPGLKAGDPIPVYLDRNDDSHYYVDVESAMPTIINH